METMKLLTKMTAAGIGMNLRMALIRRINTDYGSSEPLKTLVMLCYVMLVNRNSLERVDSHEPS